jgi:hypothetical protein
MQVVPQIVREDPSRGGMPRRALMLKAASFAVIGIVNTLIDLTVFLTLTRYSSCRSFPRTSWRGWWQSPGPTL